MPPCVSLSTSSINLVFRGLPYLIPHSLQPFLFTTPISESPTLSLESYIFKCILSSTSVSTGSKILRGFGSSSRRKTLKYRILKHRFSTFVFPCTEFTGEIE
ncbi:hypothetical protein CEXT_161591 [Caerostris extrusa]|uniref:Uncharacterized protein n=1 Tax=Caerostris extrusa TaxID=172846 RepID=A0AAV4MRW5_CAEEX|nr:hypothetical protein CEXT_161591 [Caerostris extrusa]